MLKKEIIVNCNDDQTRVALLESGHLAELFIERQEAQKIVGNIYKGRVKSVLPGLQSAFVDIGLEKDGFLSVKEVFKPGKGTKIEKMLRKGEEVFVQIKKEALGTKGVKVSMFIDLPGRILVYLPMEEHIGISKNIADEKERDRLRAIVDNNKPPQGGFIIRSEAEGVEEKQFKREMQYLVNLWAAVQKRGLGAQAPALTHRDLGIVFKTVRDYFTDEVEIFLVDSCQEYEEVMDFLTIVSPELKDRAQLYRGKTPIFDAYKIEPEIEAILKPIVKLPSGGYIIIQESEGLAMIDVNSGKFVAGKSFESIVFQTNLEAAKEVAWQIRLRNIGGIIVIDFIDMDNAKNRKQITSALTEAVKGEKAKIKILPITRLGLVEMTRERQRESISKTLTEPCPYCKGGGHVFSRESMAIKIKKELLKLERKPGQEIIKLELSPEVAEFFQSYLAKLEKKIGRKIKISSNQLVHWNDYRIILD
ncbi:MAG: Rne/Rng family ribonuclease [Elusimicrobiota bacterium]